MLGRTFLSLVNLGVLGTTVAVWYSLPKYSDYILYGCLAWVVFAFALMYSSWGNRPFPGAPRSAAGPAPSGPGPAAASPSAAGASRSASRLDFCIYCAAPLPATVSRCPACGHAAARV